MKLLILAMSCNLEKYLNEEKAVRNTWGKDIDQGKYPGIDYFFFTSAPEYAIDNKAKKIYVKSGDTLDDTTDKTRQTLKIAELFFDFDYVLITNLMTFLNLKLIYEFINSNVINDDYIYGGDYVQPFNYTGFLRGNFLLFAKKYVSIINNSSDFNKIANDVDLSCILADNFANYKDYLEKIRQVEAIRHFEYLDKYNICNCFYCSLKSKGKETDFIKNSDILYKMLENTKRTEELNNLVFPIKYVDTLIGSYKLEKISD